MHTITVNVSTSYDILIGKDILKNTGELVRNVSKAKKAAIITDDIVAELYLKTVINSLELNGFKTSSFVFPNGEASKCTSTLLEVYNFLVNEEITRSDIIIALGGGVVGDLTGYASATYLRGVDFVQIPTTLLAQVDSSVGGKTAIDLESGKNLVGAFKQPICVICDTCTLNTLSDEIFADGMGEVIKYGMIKSKNLFDVLSNNNTAENMEEIIKECISIKRDVVEADEFDKGERMLLNFGHTIGHSIEKYYNFTGISHGKAVAIGMYLITELAVQKGICKKETLYELNSCLVKYGLPTATEPSLSDLSKLCLNDKKRENQNINIIICKGVGESYIHNMSIDEFYNFLNVKG